VRALLTPCEQPVVLLFMLTVCGSLILLAQCEREGPDGGAGAGTVARHLPAGVGKPRLEPARRYVPDNRRRRQLVAAHGSSCHHYTCVGRTHGSYLVAGSNAALCATAVNNPPVLILGGSTGAANGSFAAVLLEGERTTPVAIADPRLILTDVDNELLPGANITILGRLDGNAEVRVAPLRSCVVGLTV